MGIACASMLMRQPLAAYYVTNITSEWVPFTAVIEMTTIVDRSEFGGNSLVYLPRYLTQDDPFWAKSDAEIASEFIGALERMYPRFPARRTSCRSRFPAFAKCWPSPPWSIRVAPAAANAHVAAERVRRQLGADRQRDVERERDHWTCECEGAGARSAARAHRRRSPYRRTFRLLGIFPACWRASRSTPTTSGRISGRTGDPTWEHFRRTCRASYWRIARAPRVAPDPDYVLRCRLGRRPRREPAALASITEHGHEVGNHSFNHYTSTQLPPPDKIDQDIR